MSNYIVPTSESRDRGSGAELFRTTCQKQPQQSSVMMLIKIINFW
jgi:hypothetical protein